MTGPDGASRQRAQEVLDASAGRLLLPGVMHRLRNLMFKATSRLQLLELQQEAGAGLPGAAGEAQSALDEMRGLMDLLEAGAGMQAAPLWLESGSTALTRVGDCLGFPVRARQIGFRLQIATELPSLGVSPAHLLRWAAVGLRHLLDHVPPGIRGSVAVLGARKDASAMNLRFQFEPAPGYLPLALHLTPFPADLATLAEADDIRVEVSGTPYPTVQLLLPLRAAAGRECTRDAVGL